MSKLGLGTARTVKFRVPMAALGGLLTGWFMSEALAPPARDDIRETRAFPNSINTSIKKRPSPKQESPIRVREWDKSGLPNALIEKLGITQEEWEATMELNRRKAQGEYILRCERPTTRKALQHDIERIASERSETTAVEYDDAFAALGLSPEQSRLLQNHLAKIHKAALEAEIAIKQLLSARLDYDKRLQEWLTKENHAAYFNYETGKPSLTELESIRQFVAERGEVLDPSTEQPLAELIRVERAYTKLSWLGPFDGLPEVAVGEEQLQSFLLDRSRRIDNARHALGQRLLAAGLPEPTRQLLDDYYHERAISVRTESERARARADEAKQMLDAGR